MKLWDNVLRSLNQRRRKQKQKQKQNKTKSLKNKLS